jgi:DNA (cytosine-5)-methyltransferase 3A
MKLLIGGSPCTHWSIAQTKNRETEASGIGWELFLNYRIARDKYQPDYFLYENNKSMSPAIRAQITAELGVEPVLINSALVSAQNRQRLYWAGKRNPDGTYSQVPDELPADRGILLRDILETGFPLREKGYALQTGHGATAEDAIARRQRNAVAEPVAIKPLTEKEMEYMVRETKDGRNHFDFDYFHDATKDKSACVTANTHKGVPYNVLVEPIIVNGTKNGKSRTVDAHMGNLENNLVPRINNPNPAKQQYDCIAEPVRIGTIENDAKNPDHDSQQYRVYSPDGKSVTLCGNGGGLGAKTGLYATPITPPMQVNEATKLGYTVIQPGECVDLAMPQSKTRRGRAMKDKTNCLTTSCEFYEYCGTIDAPIYQVRGGMITVKGQEYPIKLRDGCYIIRKLTVRECMRLQTVPETYAFPVSPSQAYKMLGNGWTVDVIAHIMGHFEGLTAEPVEVLSMYDGMSCGHIALGKLGAEIASYHATEIDKFAIQTTQANFPDVVQLGDAFQVREDGWTYAGLTGGASEAAE